MTNRSKQKGTRWESEVADYLRHRGLHRVERRSLTGIQDRGDISGIDGWVIEAKNQNTSNWAAWMDETEQERRNAKADFGLLVVRRRLKPVTSAYAVLRLDHAVDLILENIDD